jgi:mannose-6-phosphate isomerase-like protein (cupin superfamily)
MKPVRRLVTIDDERGKSIAVEDGPAPDVRTDPARPDFVSTLVWATDRTPAGIARPSSMAHAIEPPRGGSVCRIVAFPPDDSYRGKAGAAQARAFFESMGSPQASTYSPQAPHPYMQKTPTLDFCLVLEGSITLVLDTERVQLNAGDVVVQRGTNHAWSNRSNRTCVVAISSHDAREERLAHA